MAGWRALLLTARILLLWGSGCTLVVLVVRVGGRRRGVSRIGGSGRRSFVVRGVLLCLL